MSVFIALLLAAAPDAGVVAPVRDGGTSAAVIEAPKKAAPAATSSSSELEKLKKEVAELRAKLSDTERAHAEELGKVRKQVDKLQAWVDDEVERRETEAREAERRRVNANQVQSTVQTALTQLSTGNTANLEPWLRQAEAIASPDAARLLSLARSALAQQDLVGARQALLLATTVAP